MKKLAIGIIVLLLLTCSIGLVTAENQTEKYAVINAALSPVGGELAHLIPSGSIIYHSADGITTVYTAEGKRVLKARDSDAALVPAGFGSVPATKVHDVPNGSRFTIEPGKFYTKDRGWIAGNTTRTYAPDGTLVLTVIHEKRMPKEETLTTENQSEEYVVINAPITPTEGEGPNHVPPGSLLYRSPGGITTAYAPDGKIIWKARDSDAKILGMGGLMAVPWRNVTAHGPIPATKFIGVPNGSRTTHGPIKFYTEDRGWIVGNGSKGYGPDGTLLLICAREDRTTVVETLTTENLGAEYMVKITNHVPPGSLVYHSDDGITLVYAPDGKIIVKARDFDAKTVPMSGLIPVPGRNITAREPKWATLVSAVSEVPNCTHTYEQIKFYTEDRGWIIGNAVKSYGPDGTLLLIGTSEKRTTVVETLTTENQSEEYVVINAPFTPTEGEGPNHVPPGSLIYHSNDGITTVYASDGKVILKARDSDAKALPMSGVFERRNGIVKHGPIVATHVTGVPNGSRSTYEPLKFYTEDRGWIIGNASKLYAPDGTLQLITASEKGTTCEKTVEIQKLGDSEFSGVLERTEDHVNALDEFTAYWDCPSAPPSPNPNVSVLLFNAVQDYTDWPRIMQSILCWSTENGFWNAYSMWGPDEQGGDHYWNSTPTYVDVGDKLKGEIKWNETNSSWHICIYNLDKGTNTCLECPPVGDNADLDVFTLLEAPKPKYVSDYTDLPGDTTFYDMSFNSQGSPVDIEWEKEVNSTAKGLIPELGVIIYSDSKVKLVTRGTSLDTIPLDAILVIDRSGSMFGDILEKAKTVAKTFVGLLKGQDRVGLVSFKDEATLDRHLTSNLSADMSIIPAMHIIYM